MDAYIKAISHYFPERVVSNEEIVKEFPEWTVEKIVDKIGISSRRVAAADETATDMAIQAARQLFDAHPEVRREEIDLVILCTQSPEYVMPSSACLIQAKLGLPTSCGAFDYNLGCSGYIYGLALSKGLVMSGIARNVLLLTGETLTKYIHPRDKSMRTLLGDAATATVISSEGFARIEDFVLGTDGTGVEHIIVKSGASRYPDKQNDLTFDENGNPHSSDYFFMNGSEVFSFVQTQVPKVVSQTLLKNKLGMEDIGLFVLHQANRFMLEFLRKKMRIPEERFYMNMLHIGNTCSNSIPISLIEARKEGRIKGKVLLCGFGVGFSWGGCVLTVHEHAIASE